jgi:hypothetical protein
VCEKEALSPLHLFNHFTILTTSTKKHFNALQITMVLSCGCERNSKRNLVKIMQLVQALALNNI